MASRGRAKPTDQSVGFTPADLLELFTGIPVPDPVTFTISEDYLNKGALYPRQATLLKIIFLRDDLFTAYDYKVIKEWDQEFQKTGNHGINPKILDRIKWLKENGHKWFKEVVLVLGRRSGKGHISGISMSYVLWNYMSKVDPQRYYGVDRDKRLTALIFAGKKEQAIANVYADVTKCILGSNCFTKYIVEPQKSTMKIMAPNDFVRLKQLRAKGLDVDESDVASFIIEAKESTTMAGRGSASFMQAYDEMAHVTAQTASATAEEVFVASTPALDQFGKDAFIVEPSSPWQMMGQFYQNYLNSLEMDPETGAPVYNKMLMLQLPSWDIYEDWEMAHEIPMFPEGYEGDLGEYKDKPRPYFKRLYNAIQEYDDDLRLLERQNPDTFAVERRSHFATALDAYLDPSRIAEMFLPWNDRHPDKGPKKLVTVFEGKPLEDYKAHGDPAKVNDLFGFCIAHKELGPNGRWHVVVDRVHHWDPADFDEHTIDYDQVEEEIWDEFLKPFQPFELTFDQFSSSQTIMRLKKRVMNSNLPKRGGIRIWEQTSTRPHNWKRAEVFKAALNMGFIHSPYDEELDLELKFLIKKENVDVVDHPTAGPVQRKDVADALMECVYTLIGDQMLTMQELLGGNANIQGSAPGGYEPFPGMSKTESIMQDLRRSLGGRGMSPTQGGRRPDNRLPGR